MLRLGIGRRPGILQSAISRDNLLNCKTMPNIQFSCNIDQLMATLNVDIERKLVTLVNLPDSLFSAEVPRVFQGGKGEKARAINICLSQILCAGENSLPLICE